MFVYNILIFLISNYANFIWSIQHDIVLSWSIIHNAMTRPVIILENLWRTAKKCKLDDDFFIKNQQKTEALNKIYNVTPIQCVVIAMLLNYETMNLVEMGEFLDVTRIYLLQFDDELDNMIKRRMLLREESNFRGKRMTTYRLTSRFEGALRKGKSMDAKPCSEYTLYDLCSEFSEICKVAQMLYEEDFEQLYDEFRSIVIAAKHLPTVIAMEELPLDEQEWLFAWTLVNASLTNNGKIDVDDFAEVVGEDAASDFFRELSREITTLQQQGYVEKCINQGFADDTAYRLSIRGFEELCPVVKSPQLNKIQALTQHLIQPNDIEHKDLYYNADLQKDVDRLQNLLLPSNYKNVIDRMEELGLRGGCCCLLYGAAGTGKTQLALEVAKKSHRPIFKIDISTIRNKYVGETEKIAKSIFQQYQKMVKAQRKLHQLEPILLLNEADAVLTRRNTNTENSVDKMENALQNILLDEMESLDGIMLATTNLTCNLDPAFERRFLLKMEFKRPDEQTRAKIITSMFPDLDQEDALSLAKLHDLSGGELENVRRKSQIDYVLNGVEPNFLTLCTLCEQERLDKKQTQRIGFC